MYANVRGFDTFLSNEIKRYLREIQTQSFTQKQITTHLAFRSAKNEVVNFDK